MGRFWLVLVCVASLAGPASGQKSLWRNAENPYQRSGLEIAPRPSERRAITELLKDGPSGCDPKEWTDQLKDLTYALLPVSATNRVLLVEVGRGCARGVQGANGVMWLIGSKSEKPILLAGPEQGFEGFLYSIERGSTKGYRDLVLGWHMGAGETGLAYFRFDGAVYRRIGAATLLRDQGGIAHVTPTQRSEPSFDCGMAYTSTEILICSDNELAGLDKAMADAYRGALQGIGSDDQNALRSKQRGWLRQYSKTCDSVPTAVDRKACALQSLRLRTKELSFGAQQGR